MFERELSMPDGWRWIYCTNGSNMFDGEPLFDRCFLMNIPESRIRYENFKRNLDGFDFGAIQVLSPIKVYNHPEGWCRGSWSHLLSVMTILLESRYLGYKRILVLEDDYECSSDFSSRIHESMAHLPEDWHVASFYGTLCSLAATTVKNDYWKECGRHAGQQCIAYNIEAMLCRESPFPLILMHPDYWERTERRKEHVMDRSFTMYAKTVGLNWYTICSNIGKTMRIPSDIHNESGIQDFR